MEDLPEGLFRNAIDLNRFSNGTSKKLINSYNRIILKAVAELKRIEEMPSAKRPKVRAARLRALLAQTKDSLNTWSVKSVDELAKDLEGIAQIQSDFATQQISKALSPSAKQFLSVNSIEVTPSFAKAVVNADPLDISARVLGQSLNEAVKGASGSFKLTATQGSQIRMPGGQSITKLFRGLAEKNAELFATNVQDGLLTGETTQQIARRLVGNLEFGDIGPLSVKQLAQSGGELTKLANHQVMTLTRTSINQVANKASQQVYRANSDLTSKYRYVATLDSRTSGTCRALDGKEFIYGKGPEPAQHFNCRSTTVAVIDYDKIQKKHPNVKPPSKPLGKRAAAGGSVPSNTTYGKWLHGQRSKTKSGNLSKFEPGPMQIKTLGKEKAKYFNRLADKYGPDEAMKKFVRDDGSEVSLKTFKARYGKPESIKIKKTEKLVAKTKTKYKPPSKALIAKEGQYMTAAEKAGKVKYVPLTAAQKKLIDNSTAEVLAKEKEYGLLAKKAASIKNKDEYVRQSRENEAKIRKLKTDFKKTTKKTISNNDHTYYGEEYVLGKTPEQDKFVKVGTERIKEMGYKIDNKMLDGTKKKGWSSEFERLEEHIAGWKGGSASTQMAQSWQLEQSGADLSTFAKYKAKSFKKMRAATRRRFIDQADSLEDFVKRSPSYDGQIHRGMTIRKDEFDEFLTDLATGKPTAALESWSSQLDVADEFAGIKRIKGKIGADSGFQSDRAHIMLTVKKNKYGSSITNLANDYQHEMEVLIPSKIRYTITDIEQTPIGDTGEMFWNVILEQI